MSIRDWAEKIKGLPAGLRDKLGEENYAKYYTAVVIVLVGLSSFGLGRLSLLDENRQPVIIEQDTGVEKAKTASPAAGAAVLSSQSASVASSVTGQISIIKGQSAAAGGKLVASKTGKKYFYPWCTGAAKIAEANKIWFNSEAEARANGLQPAANCKGLK